MVNKTLLDLKFWLLENEDHFNYINPIVKQRCAHCLDKTNEECIRVTYPDEFEFDDYYRRLRVLVKYLESSDSLNDLLIAYATLDKQNVTDFKAWEDWLYTTEEENYFCGEIDSMLIKDQYGKVLGFKVIYSSLYDRNPFMIPIDGFENLIAFSELYIKYIKSKFTIYIHDLVTVNNNQLN